MKIVAFNLIDVNMADHCISHSILMYRGQVDAGEKSGEGSHDQRPPESHGNSTQRKQKGN